MQWKIVGAQLINEGKIRSESIYIKDKRIFHIGTEALEGNWKEVNAEGLHLMPGIIDDQVHFREPGLTHKADIASESKAAIAGGITSFMEMPNTKPAASTHALLEEKYAIASRTSYGNYSFYLGATENNLDEVKKINPSQLAGLKIFMGSSTGDLLVADEHALDSIFKESPVLIATHCEDEPLFKARLEEYKVKFCDEIPAYCHEYIRSAEGCFLSSQKAKTLAEKHNARLHILHITTAEELALFTNQIPLGQKMITAEVCVHHLYFDSEDYAELGNKIKCNPSIKSPSHRQALLQGLLADRLDIIATDHAPHTLTEKTGSYLQAASGLPLVQHALQIMLGFYHEKEISLEKIVEKMCHAPAECFRLKDRGYLREGYFADLVLFDPDELSLVQREDLLYKCQWSPLENFQLRGWVRSTWVNGYPIYDHGRFNPWQPAMRLEFDR
jgi:dihydroorotase